jgi:hypothetical protein
LICPWNLIRTHCEHGCIPTSGVAAAQAAAAQYLATQDSGSDDVALASVLRAPEAGEGRGAQQAAAAEASPVKQVLVSTVSVCNPHPGESPCSLLTGALQFACMRMYPLLVPAQQQCLQSCSCTQWYMQSRVRSAQLGLTKT